MVLANSTVRQPIKNTLGQTFVCWCILIILACSASQVLASTLDDDFDEALKPWAEIEVKLPSRPLPENLVSVYVGPATSYVFRMDQNSISIASDGVVRYTLVGLSDQGAKNVSYEGIRCATREKKLYAFGRSDNSWARSRRNEWEPIREADRNRQHAALLNIFCDGRSPRTNLDEILAKNRSPTGLPP